MLDHLWTMLAAKSSTIVAASVGAVISILLNLRDHSFLTATISLIAGVFVAYVATEPVIVLFGLNDTAGNAVAGALGVAGRNLIIWLRESSKDPVSIVLRLLGRKPPPAN